MATALKNQLRQIFVALFCISALGYFIVYAVAGRHGLEHRRALVARLAVADEQASKLEVLRMRLSNDVSRLAAAEPDADLVSEFAFRELGYIHPNARVLDTPRP